MGAPEWWPGPTLNGSYLGYRQALDMVEALQRFQLELVARNRAEGQCCYYLDRIAEVNAAIEALKPGSDSRFGGKRHFREAYRKARRRAREAQL